MPYRLAVIDLDDTLLGPDKEISPANLEALHRLRSHGIEIVIASGRHHDNIARFEKNTGCEGWTISSQGAVVKQATTGEVLYELTIPSEIIGRLCQRGRELGMTLICYHRTGIFMEQESEWTQHYARNAGQTPLVGDFQALAATGLQKLLWFNSRQQIDDVLPGLRREYQDRLYLVQTEYENIEFLSPEANKARGAQVVAEKLGISREDVLAFGDGNNDVPLLEWAGMSVAMNHGRLAAQRAARLVTPSGPPEEAFARGVLQVLDS